MTPGFLAPPAWGTPARDVHIPAHSYSGDIGHGVTVHSGVNPEMARIVDEQTSAGIAWPFAHLGFLAEDGRHLAFVLHRYEPETNRIEISGVDGDLPWSRAILRSVAFAVFTVIGASEIAVRVRPEDRVTRRFVQRLGFSRIGAEARPGDLYRVRHLYVLPASAARRLGSPPLNS